MQSRSGWWVLVAAIALGAPLKCVPQERIVGRAKVIDGDSFEVGSTGVRLYGVDAPEGRQPCTRNGRDWRCGEAAAAELRRLIGARDVVCQRRDQDDYGRIVAVCRSGNTDLGAAMVRAGLAVAYRRYSSDYVDEERQAQSARRGLWAGEFANPAEWRQRDERRTSAASRPDLTRPAREGCAIKGNINGDGERIYHVPGSASYDDTVIDDARGERWFCSETEARREGWRAPRG
jgi:endonuclease YncB( thermonuclease family)